MNFKFLALILCLTISISLADEYHHSSSLRNNRRKISPSPSPLLNIQEGSRTFWRNKAQNHLMNILSRQSIEKKAKNVILFLGDGMGMTTVSATRPHMGNENNLLSFERFPFYGLSKTYCLNRQVPDSACTATAYATGVKTNYNALGVNGNVLTSNCTINQEDYVHSIIKWAQDAGKGTGIVTTTRVTHATPAGFYSHVQSRSVETDTDLNARCSTSNIKDIAHQLIYNEEGKKLKVILGGGRRAFRNSTIVDEEGRAGLRSDGRDLIKEWVDERSKVGNAKFVWHKSDLMSTDITKTDYLMGLFEHDHCRYQQEINDNSLQHQEPSLSEMMSVALKMLMKEENGFFLLVEGGRIDLAHHSNYARRSLEETREFSFAIDKARSMTDESDTLIVVTADHSHPFTHNGYPWRGNDALGAAEISGIDDLTYDSVSYANGPGYPTTYEENGNSFKRVDLSNVDMRNPLRRSTATVPLSSETHSGEVSLQ